MRRKIPKDTSFFHYHNENPEGNRTNDCVVRSIACATGKSWDEVMSDLCSLAQTLKLMPNDPSCYSKYLESLGWVKYKQPRKDDNTKYHGIEFCGLLDSDDCPFRIPYKTSIDSVIAHIGARHITCIKLHQGVHKVFDTWNCSGDCIGNYWAK